MIRWAVAPTGLRFRRRIAEELKRVEPGRLALHVDSAALRTVGEFVAVLQGLQALAEHLPNRRIRPVDVQTARLVLDAVGNFANKV